MESEKRTSIFKKFLPFMDRNNETVKALSYGIGTAGLFIALYRIRPFAKFKMPSNLPAHLLSKRIPLRGSVMRIEPSAGILLMVDHEPLLPFPRLNTSRYLPVKIANVNVTIHGVSWLQTVVVGRQITFVPLARNNEYLECIVNMLQQNQEWLNIGEELVKVGFATVKIYPLKATEDKQILIYQRCLENAQKWAQRKRNGYWHFASHPTLLWKMQQSIDEISKSMLPTFK